MGGKTIEIEFLGRCPKVVELPVPFVSKCRKTGEVVCDPIGVFPEADGEALLKISGPKGLFRRANNGTSKQKAPKVKEPKVKKDAVSEKMDEFLKEKPGDKRPQENEKV